MMKLFNLKEWLTLSEAAQHLSILFGNAVNEADVLRLALDGHLLISVNFVNHAKACPGKVVAWEETEWSLFPDPKKSFFGHKKDITHQSTAIEYRRSPPKLATLVNEIPLDERDNYYPLMSSLNLDGERFLNLDKEVITLQGVWDLAMIGGERLDIEHEYQRLTGGPAVTLVTIDGAFVKGLDGNICQLQDSYEDNEYHAGSRAQFEKLKIDISEGLVNPIDADKLLKKNKDAREKFLEKKKNGPASENYYPASGLPNDGVIVVRTEALRKFEYLVNGSPKLAEKPLGKTERNTLLTIIAALCKYESLDPQGRGSATEIMKMTDDLGVHVDDDTIRRYLKSIPDALESRMK